MTNYRKKMSFTERHADISSDDIAIFFNNFYDKPSNCTIRFLEMHINNRLSIQNAFETILDQKTIEMINSNQKLLMVKIKVNETIEFLSVSQIYKLARKFGCRKPLIVSFESVYENKIQICWKVEGQVEFYNFKLSIEMYFIVI